MLPWPREFSDAIHSLFGPYAIAFLFAGYHLFQYLKGRDAERARRLDQQQEDVQGQWSKLLLEQRQELANRAEALSKCRQNEVALIADRDRGWNLVRELDDRLHSMRHDANNRIYAAWIAGRNGEPNPPLGLPIIPNLQDMQGRPPQ